jgi:hypothetical protein
MVTVAAARHRYGCTAIRCRMVLFYSIKADPASCKGDDQCGPILVVGGGERMLSADKTMNIRLLRGLVLFSPGWSRKVASLIMSLARTAMGRTRPSFSHDVRSNLSRTRYGEVAHKEYGSGHDANTWKRRSKTNDKTKEKMNLHHHRPEVETLKKCVHFVVLSCRFLLLAPFLSFFSSAHPCIIPIISV